MSDQDPGQDPSRLAELDEFLSRAVDRQIAEQRALREAFVELADQVRALQTDQGDEVDPEDLIEQIRRINQAYSDVVVAEVREIRDAIAAAARAEEDEETVDPEEVIEQIRRISQAYSDAVIAEVRDVREAIASQPDVTPAADGVDPQEVIEQIRRISQANSDALAGEIRAVREAIAAQAEHSIAAPQPAASDGPHIDPDAVVEQIRHISQAYADAVIAEIREASERSAASVPAPAAAAPPSTEGSDAVIAELRDVRDELLTQMQRPAPAQPNLDLAPGLGELQGTVGAMYGDVEGIAQALIDLNAGLRDWADGVDVRIVEMQQAVDVVSDFASQTQELRAEMLEAMQLRDDRGYDDRGPDEAPLMPSQELAVTEAELVPESEPAPRVAISDSVELDQRIRETVDLTLYLADQVDAFGRVLQAIGDLPTRLEGVVSQALRRTLTARSKLDNEATTEIRTALQSLDTYIDRVDDIVSRFAASEDAIRKLSLGQVEVTSRIDSLNDAISERLDDVEADRRRTEEILAGAIDAVGEGMPPKARSTLAKATKSSASRRRKPKATRSKATRSKAKQPKTQRKRSPRKPTNT